MDAPKIAALAAALSSSGQFREIHVGRNLAGRDRRPLTPAALVVLAGWGESPVEGSPGAVRRTVDAWVWIVTDTLGKSGPDYPLHDTLRAAVTAAAAAAGARLTLGRHAYDASRGSEYREAIAVRWTDHV